MSEPTRRAVLAGAAGISAAVTLAACGDDKVDVSGGAGDGAAPPAAGAALGSVADIPVGGGRIFSEQKVVVTQPSAGQIKAYSIMCTHQGCPVTSVDNGNITCSCHNSRFSIADGSVVNGPATEPLPTATVKVDNGQITLG